MEEVGDVPEEHADREEGFAGKIIYDVAADIQQNAQHTQHDDSYHRQDAISYNLHSIRFLSGVIGIYFVHMLNF